jgi:hypothetical protein
VENEHMPILRNQDLMDEIGKKGLIRFTGNLAKLPKWDVDLDKLRTLLTDQEKQSSVLSPAERTDEGNIPVETIGSKTQPTPVPTIVVIGGGADRSGLTARPNGTTVTLKAPKGKSGLILIALGGDGYESKTNAGTPSDGGDATVEGEEESLLIAMGGVGGTGFEKSGNNGGKGGNASVVGKDTNHACSQGGKGGNGSAGLPALHKGNAGEGGRGGNAKVQMDAGCYIVALGGNGGTGGPGTKAPFSQPGNGGDGGDTTERHGSGSIVGDDIPGGSGAPGGPGANRGTRGKKL